MPHFTSSQSLLRCAPFAAGCLALICAVDAADISWNVLNVQVLAEGASLTRAAFSDGAKSYALSVDAETAAQASGAGSRFTFKPLPSAAFEIQPSPVLPALPFNAETYGRYKAAAKLRIPAGVEGVADLEEMPNPLTINLWKSYRVSFSYSQHGRRVWKCVTFLTLESGQQAMLETSAYDAEFKPAMERSDYLIRSWHELANKSTPPSS